MANKMERYLLELENITVVGEDYYVFDFKMPKDINFKAGQYGIFMHVDKEIEGRKVRALSIASNSNEDTFKAAVKIVENPSDFKLKMRNLQIGDTMTFDGPIGHFILEEDYHGVFIAGGIGITPIRGIVKQIEELKLNKEYSLIYSEPRGIYPFQNELDNFSFLEKFYRTTIENTQEAINNVSSKYLNTAFYYVSGSPAFINAVKELLVELGIEMSNIKFDRFIGY